MATRCVDFSFTATMIDYKYAFNTGSQNSIDNVTHSELILDSFRIVYTFYNTPGLSRLRSRSDAHTRRKKPAIASI